MNLDEMLLSSHLLVLLVSVSIDPMNVVSVREATFKKVIGSNPGMGTLVAGWPEHSKMRCAVACVQLYGRCFAYTYNETSTMCTLGHSVAGTSPYSLQPPQGSLYASTVCDVNSGFSLYSKANLTICLWISTTKANGSTAEKSCDGRGGNLVTLQTQEKFDIFRDITIRMNLQIWIGVDDRLVEDEFRWHNDGTVMTSAQRASLFNSSQPDDNYGEDCVKFIPAIEKLYDAPCRHNHFYICETEPAFN